MMAVDEESHSFTFCVLNSVYALLKILPAFASVLMIIIMTYMYNV